MAPAWSPTVRARLVAVCAFAWMLAASACADLPVLPPESTDDGTPPVLEPTDGVPDDPGITDLTPEDVETFHVDSLDPTEGPIEGLVAVTFQGGGFRDSVRVFFGESAALESFVLTETTMLAYAPPRPPGLVDVTLTDYESGQTLVLESAFLYENPLQLLSIEPPTGHVLGGQPVVITATGLTPDATVLFGDRKAIGTVVIDESTLHCITPEGDAVGPVDVRLTSAEGNHLTVDGFTYVDVPEIDKLDPPAAIAGAAATLDIFGDGFVAPLVATVAGLPLADVVVHDPTHLSGTLVVPPEVGAHDVSVATGEGVGIAPGAFTVLPAGAAELEVVTVFPATGATHGGDVVTLVVTGLVGAGATQVTFGGAPAAVLGVNPASHAIVVAAPPADDAGPVDVHVTHHGEVATATDGFAYELHPFVEEILPNHGDVAGGTPITIHGSGFATGAQVRVGALPAASVVVSSPSTIEALTPPGTAGLVNVRVEVDGEADTLVGGFAYTDGLQIWGVEPGQGAMAGGTLVEILGSGFVPGLSVRFGDLEATQVEVLSPTKLQLVTPPGYIGKTDVTVTLPEGGQAVKPDGFIYYDPAGSFGGTWGEPIEKTLNVAVLEWGSLAGVPDALVVVGTDPATDHVGTTDANGHITFSGLDLDGPQMVTAGRVGFTTSSLVAFDAENVTLLIGELPSCGNPNVDCNPPSATYEGQVINTFKGIQMPWGSCEDVPEQDAGGLCEPCVTDEDCREEARCTELFDQGHVCTSDCESDLECPSGFTCVPMTGMPPQCVPTAGKVEVYCIANNNTAFPATPDDDGKFTIYVPLGEFAVGCWAGVSKNNQFTPQMFGVHRHVVATVDEQVVTGEVRLDHPVNRDVEIHLDRPPIGPDEDLEYTQVTISLVLGSDGGFTIPGQGDAMGRDPHHRKVLAGLTGDLWGATYDITAKALTGTNPFAGSELYERGIEDFVADRAWRWIDETWEPIVTGLDETVYALAPTESGILAVGAAGLIVRDVGQKFATQPANTDADLLGVSSLGSGAAIAVGTGGTAIHYDGLVWTPVETGTEDDLQAVWMAASSSAWAVGGTKVLRFGGAVWSHALDAGAPLHAVHGAGDEVWIAGDAGTMARWDGAGWTVLQPEAVTADLRAVWTTGEGDVWFAGRGGAIVHHDGVGFTVEDTPTTADLLAIWGRSADEVYAVGARGTVLVRRDGAWVDESRPGHLATLHAVGGGGEAVWAMGAQEIILGPMLSLPEDLYPADGGLLQDAIEWTSQPSVTPSFNAVFVQSAKTCQIEYCEQPATMTIMNDLWLFYGDGPEQRIDLPASGNVPESTGVQPGSKGMAVWRVLLDGEWSFDNATYLDFWQYGLPWRAWSYNETMVAVP